MNTKRYMHYSQGNVKLCSSSTKVSCFNVIFYDIEMKFYC